ncbi:MAG: peptide-methionine (S)-S-oxide reductase MsrA [Gammaproteobacteria bacterium]|nr:peptide-methionine (S)-S-oxide reductase MsrA [Gammaproteobacteria bacterium]
MLGRKSLTIPSPENALPGRDTPMTVTETHYVKGNRMQPPFAQGLQQAMFGLGCFWGAERCFWRLEGVYVTAVGYAAGYTPNPSYEEVCSGQTGHNEVIFVVFDPNKISYAALLKKFWESHNPTQGMQQGNDSGTQYRSGIYTYSDEQMALAKQSLIDYQSQLKQAGYGAITTEIKATAEFYYAETYHQQYLEKNPNGYCGLGGTDVACSLTGND